MKTQILNVEFDVCGSGLRPFQAPCPSAPPPHTPPVFNHVVLETLSGHKSPLATVPFAGALPVTDNCCSLLRPQLKLHPQESLLQSPDPPA